MINVESMKRGRAALTPLPAGERSTREARRVRGRATSSEAAARPLTRIAARSDLSPAGRGEGRPYARFALLCTALAWAATAVAEDSAKKIPDFSGGWDRIGTLLETYEAIPGFTGPGPLLVDPEHPHVNESPDLVWVPALDNPILTPQTLARLKPIVEAELKGIPHIKNEGHCEPSGVPGILNVRGGVVEFLQTPTQVTIMYAKDAQVRRVYLDVPHSSNPRHSWYGESVGHYEGGDTLVVDTIGLNDKTQIDRFGTSHSDRIHVVERYRVAPDHKTLEVQFTVDDPGAFTMPWSARVRLGARPPRFDEQVCAENNRFVGLVFDGGKATTSVYTPTAQKPDF
jgi:hypothetical protein